MPKLITFIVIASVFTVICVFLKSQVTSYHFSWDNFASSNESYESDDYFNRQYFHLDKFGRYDLSSETSTLARMFSNLIAIYRREKVIVKEYTKIDLVRCIDFLSEKRSKRPMHIAFIGDSTVRQLFSTFIRWIPDYDRSKRTSKTAFAEYHFHENRNVTSRLLNNLLVSFYWRNLIRRDLIKDFKTWASSKDYSTVPDFILLGVTAHHVGGATINNVTKSLKNYEELLENELLPLINESLRIHRQQKIVWLLQSQVIDQFAPSTYEIFSGKIIKYNEKIRRIFENTRVVIWDSLNAVVEEYQRACALSGFMRQYSTYFNCQDFIHPGLGALSFEIELFMNHLCNK